MTKAKAPAKGMSFTQLVGTLIAVAVLAAAGAGGAFKGIGGHGHGPKRSGEFEVAVEWHAISGGVSIEVTKNGSHRTHPPVVRAPAATPSRPAIYHFRGWSTDSVVSKVKELNPSGDPDPTGYLFTSILFKGDDGNISLPEYARDTSPVDLNGITARW